MPVFVVANPKGGVGKSTIATSLAGYLAHKRPQVMLDDIDVQQSSAAWLGLRPPSLPAIHPCHILEGRIARPLKGTTHMALDTPAGLAGAKLDDVLKLADKIVVPLQASIFDILATQSFLEKLLKRCGKVDARVVGMKVNLRSRSSDHRANYVGGQGLPVLGYLRDTQSYVQLAAHGATLWDVAPLRVDKDLEQWPDLVRWADR